MVDLICKAYFVHYYKIPLQARTLCGDDKNAMIILKIQNNNDILITWFKSIVVLGTFC